MYDTPKERRVVRCRVIAISPSKMPYNPKVAAVIINRNRSIRTAIDMPYSGMT
ncbi:hypothetical protein D3C80_2125810 [compost metagenome]